MSGGEPLSSELEAKIGKVKAELRASYFTGGPGRHAEWWAKVCPEILRAFAREIQEPLAHGLAETSKTLEETSLHYEQQIGMLKGLLFTARDEMRASQSREKALSEQLTDARESARSLAEALEKALAGGELMRRTGLPPHDVSGTAMWQEGVRALADVSAWLRAYREAGRGKTSGTLESTVSEHPDGETR